MKESLELIKAGYENAQARIVFMDSKVGVVSAFLVVIVPTPWVMFGWMATLEKNRLAPIMSVVKAWPLPATFGILAIVGGSILGLMALLHAFECAQPRGPKPIPGSSARCNVIFPAIGLADTGLLEQHLRQVHSGMQEQFPLDQYKEQLLQVGWILDAKMAAMRRCFAVTRLAVLWSFSGAAIFLIYLLVGLLRS